MDKIRVGKKIYKIRPNGPADVFITYGLPVLALLAILVVAGLMNSWELGLL